MKYDYGTLRVNANSLQKVSFSHYGRSRPVWNRILNGHARLGTS